MAARILVADDSVTIQKVVELTFSKEDFLLVQARSGEEAIRKAKEIRPDLILLDLVMPDKNGYEVCVALRAEPMLRAVPIILLTGTFETLDKEKGFRAGANDFVTKPFESQVLISKVKQLLFTKTVDLAAAAPAREAPRPTPTVAASPPPPAAPPMPSPGITPPAPMMSAPSAPPSGPPVMAAPVVPPGPPAPAGAPLEAAAPAPPPAPPAELGELSLEDLVSLPTPPLEASHVSPTAGAGIPPLPESLSLEELLSADPAAPSPAPKAEPALREEVVPEDEPVFDLTSEMGGPSLPLVEVGAGEPPSLSDEDFLSPTVTAPPDTDTMPMAGLELELMPEATAPPSLGALAEVTPERAEAIAPEAHPVEDRMPTSEAAPPMAAPVADAIEVIPGIAAGRDSLTSAVRAAVLPGDPGALGSAAEMATMRQDVTERVAHELARDLSDKLLERIERIVWEVVPDLAEILITKEIERIRAMAEGKQSS